MITPIHKSLIMDRVRQALDEDLGLAGDITTTAIIDAGHRSVAKMRVREAGVVAGVDIARTVFDTLDTTLCLSEQIGDGSLANAGDTVLQVSGSTRAILAGERVALNFLQRLSGVATVTHRYVENVSATKARIVCTRKTTPGLRAFEKYAVRVGGGFNHRFGLFDAALIKDNHIAAAGGVANAIVRAKERVGHLVKIEVEVDTLDQLREAIAFEIDAVLLDNMSIDQLRDAVTITKAANSRILCEASGGVSLDTVRAIAETGVDLISVGALTHSSRSLDIGLDFA